MWKKSALIVIAGAALLARAFDVLFVPTLAVNIPDQVRFVMPERGIHVPSVSRVERGQPFELSIAVVIREPLTAPLKLTGSIIAKGPNGKETEAVKPAEMFSIPVGVRGVFFSKLGIRGYFEPHDPIGEHQWTLTLKDEAGAGKTATAKIELVDAISDAKPMDKAEFESFFTRYYRQPRPERALAALRYFLTEGSARMRKKNGANPLHVLSGFAEIFRLNPQFWDELAAATTDLSEEQQLSMALIFAGIGKKAVMSQKEVIDPQVQAQIGLFAGKNPLAFSQVKTPAHLDMLWMQFFVTGKFEPIRRLAWELRARPGMTLKEAKARADAKKPLSDEEKKEVLGQLIRHAAHWSLVSNLRQGNQLEGFYLETIVRRKLFTDKTAAAMIVHVLKQAQTQKQRGN